MMKAGVFMIGKMNNKTLDQIFLALLLIVCILFLSNYIVYKYLVNEMYIQVSDNNMQAVNNYFNAYKAIKTDKIIIILTLVFGFILAILASIKIKNVIIKIKNENELLKNQISTVRQEILKSVFYKVIDETGCYKNLRDQIDTYFGIAFSAGQFIMVSFILEPVEDYKVTNHGHSFVFTEDANAIIQETINKRFDKTAIFHIKNMQFIALIGIDQQIKKEAIFNQIKLVNKDLSETILCNYYITTAVSKLYSHFQECKKAFEDIELCIAFRDIKSKSSFIDAEEIVYNCDIYYPVDFIEKLSNNILSGNSKECINILNQIVTKMESSISYFKLVNTVTSIFNNIINTLLLCNYEKDEIRKIEQIFFKKINNREKYTDIIMYLNTIIFQITEKIEIKNQSKLNKDYILQYINLHYSENLYLDNIAEILGTTPKYFSKYFKKVFGVNFVEKLNKIKISHGKEYLKNTDTPVSEIGRKIGYADSSTFTSNFKKYCGISPAEYRKENRRYLI